MAYDDTCFYCTKDQRLHDLMIPVKTLQTSTLYLFREQTHPGRCILALNDHVKEVYLLDTKTVQAMAEDIKNATQAIQQIFNPDKINYAAFGDKVTHLHFHLVPKYENGPQWGQMFEMMPENKVYLTEEEYSNLIKKLHSHL